jgi:glycerol-1-phosphate dehydrogenase [NAD(P)+]
MMATATMLPPPVFKYDPANMPELEEKIKRWPDYDQIPEIELKRVIVGEDAIQELPKVLRELAPAGAGEIVLVMDKVPFTRQGASLKPMVKGMLAEAGFEVHVVELAGDQDGVVHPDFHEVEFVKSHLRPGIVAVTLGSGVVSDITKHACFLFDQEHPDQPHLPAVFCMTANSVPAYGSRMAIISKDGVKRTWPSRLSDVIIADLKTLCEAPLEYSLGGIGDMCAMFPAFADWYLAEYFGMTKFLRGSWWILEDVTSLMFPYSEEIGKRSKVGMEVLAKVLTLGGLTMTYARESAPVSGFEHVVSHMLDMAAPHFGRRIANHGSQVAVAGIPALIGLGWLLDNLDPKKIDIDKCYPPMEVMEKRVKDTFAELDPSGAMGAECWNDYRQKLEAWYKARPRFEAFLADWDNQKAQLESLMTRAEPYVKALASAGHPLYFEELNVPVPESQARWAYHHAHMMRKRFSSGDLINFLGWFDEAWTDRVFARMHELVDEER